MSIQIAQILAAAPATTRGQPTQLSCDPKGERIAYASGKSVFVRSIDNPSNCKQYTGHTAAATVARFSPSGFYVASGDVSGQVRVWDALECVNTKGEYSIISGRITDVAWDGDSARLLAVGDGRERFGAAITADSGNSVGEVSGHSKVINAVAVRQQRPLRAATVSDDGSMCFLHGAPFKFVTKESDAHRGFVLGTAYSPDGNTLVTVGADKRIQLYDGKTGEATKVVGADGEQHTGSIFAVSWAKDSKRFVTASADQTVRMWDAESGSCLYTWRLGPQGAVSVLDQQVGVVWVQGRSDNLVISLSLSGDLNYLVEGTPKPTKVVQGHNKTITAMTGSSEGSRLISGSFEGRICTWDVTKGHGAVVDGESHTNQVTQLASATGQTHSVGWDDTLRLVDEAAGTFAGSSVKLSAQPKGVAAAESGRIVVALQSGVAVYTKDHKLGSEQTLNYTPTAIAAHGAVVAIGADGNAVKVYKLGSDHKLTEMAVLKSSTAAISTLAFSRDGKHLAAGNASGKIFVFAAGHGAEWPVVTDRWSAHTARVTSVAWNDEGTHAISGALDTHVFLWSVAKPGSRVKALNAHKDGVTGVSWYGDKVATAGGDAAVKLWTVKLS